MSNKKVAVCGLLVGAAMMFTGCGATTVNLNDYLSYETKGFDGYGSIETSLDEGGILEALSANAGNEDDFISFVLDNELSINGQWSQETNLSNGDKITYTWNVNKDNVKKLKQKCKIELKYNDISTKVENLKDISQFDATDYLNVYFNGVAPFGMATVVPTIQGLGCTIEPSDNLSNGDTVSVKIMPYDQSKTMEEICAANNIPTFTKLDYEFTVEGIPTYASSLEEIPTEIYDKIKSVSDEFMPTLYSDTTQCGTQGDFFLYRYKHCNFTDCVLDKAILKPAQNGNPNTLFMLYKFTYEDHGTQNTYLMLHFDGILTSLEDTNMFSFAASPNILYGMNYNLQNEDTNCEMMGVPEDYLDSFLNDYGISY